MEGTQVVQDSNRNYWLYSLHNVNRWPTLFRTLVAIALPHTSPLSSSTDMRLYACVPEDLLRSLVRMYEKEEANVVCLNAAHSFLIPFLLFLSTFMSSPVLEATSLQLELITSDGLQLLVRQRGTHDASNGDKQIIAFPWNSWNRIAPPRNCLPFTRHEQT